MIDIYFVRHGQTDGNVAKRHQVEHTKLTPEGNEQVAQTAQWSKTIAPTHFLSSRHVRALQTAEIIGEAIDMIPETHELFIELRRPDTLYGHRHRSVRSMVYLLRWYLGFAGGDGNNGEGESYKVFRERLEDAQKYLKSLPDGSRVLVVSHAVFIGFMLEHLCDKQPISLWHALKLFRNLLRLHNGSYSQIRYYPDTIEGTCGWELVSYDNHKHIKG